MAEQWWRLGARELAAMIRSRDVSSREVVESHLARVDEVNPTLNAVVRILADEALVAADAADQAIAAGHAVGPLHGVPITVKENIDLAGTATTNSLPALAEAVAHVDAPVVERMRSAGAIPFARTNLPDLGLRVTTDSSLHGITRNPWDLTRTAGGSSGGEAAAIASGMSPLGLGNDIGGSLRNPAHCCGIASIKPTTGVVPLATVVPPENHMIMFQLMCVEGVMARRVADVREGFITVAGAHPRDPVSVPAVLTDARPGEALRIGVMPHAPTIPSEPGVAAVVESAAEHLAARGHQVEHAVPPGYERVVELWAHLLLGDLSTMRPLLEMVMGEAGQRFIRHVETLIPPSDLATFSAEHAERDGLAREWSLWFQQYDVLICPTWPVTAFPEGADIVDEAGARRTLEILSLVVPENLLGLPAAIVPGGLSDGLPVGVQVVGGRFTDLRCLAVADEIEAAVGPLTPIDPSVGGHSR